MRAIALAHTVLEPLQREVAASLPPLLPPARASEGSMCTKSRKFERVENQLIPNCGVGDPFVSLLGSQVNPNTLSFIFRGTCEEYSTDTGRTHTWQGLNMQFKKKMGGKCGLVQIIWVKSLI